MKLWMLFLGIVLAASAARADECWPLRTVVRVIDGDTVVLDGGEHVRLLGIDAPERRQQGWRKATDAVKAMLLHHRVMLEYDSHGRLDRYGRTLAYLWYEDNDAWRMANRDLLARGLVACYTRFPIDECIDRQPIP